MASRPRIDVSADFESLAHRVAQWITDLACAAPGRFSIALSGGSTPKRLYQLLAAKPLVDAVPWERVHIFFGDDRFVPWDDPNSNYGMANEAMLSHVPLPKANIHGISFKGSMGDAAQVYEHELKSYYGSDTLDPARPLFDVVLLGMGPDGHTASLVPGDPVLGVTDRDVALTGEYQGRRRMTLTYPMINRSRKILWLVTGADKVEALGKFRAGDTTIPAGRIAKENAMLLAEKASVG